MHTSLTGKISTILFCTLIVAPYSALVLASIKLKKNNKVYNAQTIFPLQRLINFLSIANSNFNKIILNIVLVVVKVNSQQLLKL